MMKNISILGVSKDSIAIIFDLLEDVHQAISFDLYPNLENDTIPFLPNQNINYKIMSVGTSPGFSTPVFFGCATPKVKESIFNHFIQCHQIKQNQYLKVLHSTSYIAKSSTISNGVMIEPHVVISSQSTIGFGVFIKRGSLIGHHNSIGDYTDINPGVTLSGKVKIGKSCTIGSGSVVRDNITIGDNSLIGIGSIVTKDIPANCIAFGNPCKVIREI